MNVLNKLKSKKGKEPLRITDPPPPPISIDPPNHSQSSNHSLSQPSPHKKEQILQAPPRKAVFREQKREPVRPVVIQRCKDEVEVDEATVTDYISKKDKEKRTLLNRGESSDQFREEDYKACLNVKKGYTIGSICLFQGELVLRNGGKEERHKRMSVSCGADAVCFPESIAKIILSRVTFLSQEEAVFVGEDIVRIVQKGYAKK